MAIRMSPYLRIGDSREIPPVNVYSEGIVPAGQTASSPDSLTSAQVARLRQYQEQFDNRRLSRRMAQMGLSNP